MKSSTRNSKARKEKTRKLFEDVRGEKKAVEGISEIFAQPVLNPLLGLPYRRIIE